MEKKFITELSGVTAKHSPEILLSVGAAGMIASVSLSAKKSKRYYIVLYLATGNRYYLVRHMQLIHTNNWLKMHGYPMKRSRFKD